PLACKTDRIDAQVLAELARRDLVPEVWLPDPRVRGERERARFRLHLVKHRTMLKIRINQTLVAHGLGRPTRHLCGPKGRVVLERLPVPEPWHGTLCASLLLIESLDEQIATIDREPRVLGADHPYVPLLISAPGIAWNPRLHDRQRDRRHHPLPNRAQADRLHRPLPARLPIRRDRPAQPARQERVQLPAMGADRGRPHRRTHHLLPANRRAHAHSPRPPARLRARLGRDRPPTQRSDLWMLTRNQPFAPAGAL